MKTYIRYLPQYICIYVENCVTYIHRTLSKYVRTCMKLYIKRKVDTAFGYICIGILDIYITIWIHILYFGYIYYNLDIYIYIYIYIYILQFGHIYCNLDIYIVFWTYILQFGYIYCNLDIYISLFDILILFDKHSYATVEIRSNGRRPKGDDSGKRSFPYEARSAESKKRVSFLTVSHH